MSIRLRRVNGILVALCAARSVEKPGDVYLDDNAHHALVEKFARDYNKEGIVWPIDQEMAELAEQEESNNSNREAWEKLYGQDEGPLLEGPEDRA